ncbi:MAG: ADP-ribosylglycohydrolase family protein [Planctomycetota bacterium]|jgi:ADP-ribosylglycohydrolase
MIPLDTRRRIDRLQGALAGALLGDAVGSGVDGWSVSTIRSRLGPIQGPRSMDDRAYLLGRVRSGERPRKVLKSLGTVHPPGLYNHFGQQTLIAAECVLRHGSVSGESFAAACVRLASPSRRGKFGLHRKPSPVFRQSLGRVMAGEDWRESGEEAGRTESLPAALPVGLTVHEDPETLTLRAAEVALVTDRTGPGVMSAVALAHLAALVADRDPLSPAEDALSALLERLQAAERILGESLGETLLDGPERLSIPRNILASLGFLWIGEGGEETDRMAMKSLGRVLSRLPEHPSTRLNAGYAPAGVAAAAYLALSETRGPDRTILRAANLGGRTAALASLAGGLAGARWGRRALPQEWIDVLWNGAEVLRMGECIARLPDSVSWKGDLHALETETNRRYYEYRDALRKEILGGARTGGDTPDGPG